MEFNSHSMISAGHSGRTFERPGSDIKKLGFLKKLKTMKKKYFVLRSTSSSGPARLEYYDSEKKYKSGTMPKRSLQLHTCFNINKKSESRNCKNGIALYTSEDCFVVLADSEEEQESWLSVMLEFQNEYLPDGDMHKEHYEYVWEANLQPKDLGKAHKGSYRICLNSTTVFFVKSSSSQAQFTIQLVTIRQVAYNDCLFRMEVGKYAPTGEGVFWFNVEDSNIAKDMHGTMLRYMHSVKEPSLKNTTQFRTRSESHSSMSPNRRRQSKPEQRPQSFYTPTPSWHTLDSSCSYNQFELGPGPHRPRSDTGDSRISRASSQFEDSGHELMTTYNGDIVENMSVKDERHVSIVPEDMSPPPSPSGLDEEINAYLEMEPGMRNSGNLSTPPASLTCGPAYLSMNLSTPSHTHPLGELSPVSDQGHNILPGSYPAVSHSPPSSIPIHSHAYVDTHHSSHSSHPVHPTHPPPLPTVKEGGSNEGYLPMDTSSSPSMSSIPRPDPAKCMLSDDNSGLPPRTYSLGSKPAAKKYSGYMEMAPRKGAMGNDMSRAISAPHIINKGRRDRDREQHVMDSPTPSPLSMSVKSDDSDSFMEYMPMRPRTASDSFNYRPRTSSFGKLQPTCRPRSSSHGQGTRPFTKVNKLILEQGHNAHDPLQRLSRESSLHGSFDSLRVSNESLRRMSQDSRCSPVVLENEEVRGSPPLIGKNGKNDSYMNMDVSGNRKSSPHRMRTDSTGSGRHSNKMSSSDRSLHSQDSSNYTEMAPVNARVTEDGGYMNMGFSNSNRQSAPVSGQASSMQSSRMSDSAYMSMETVGDPKNRQSDGIRSVSVENVDSYITYDPAPMSSNKPRTGSLGSKDKKITQGLKKSTSGSPSSCPHQPSVSASTRKGGSSDSLRKTARQSSMEKYGSLGKDFRKKSGSTGSRPVSSKGDFFNSSSIMPLRNPPQRTGKDEPADEYIEFSPSAVISESDSMAIHGVSGRPTGLSHGITATTAPSARHSHTILHPPAAPPTDDSAYTLYSPGTRSSFHHSMGANEEDSSYMPFAPGTQPLSRSPHSLHENLFSSRSSVPSLSSAQTQAKQISAKEMPDYVGFDPRPSQHPPIPVPPGGMYPTSAVSYIVGDTNSCSNSKLKNLKTTQHVSLDSNKQSQRKDRKADSTSQGIPMSTSLTFDPPSYSRDPLHPQQHQSCSSSISKSSSSTQLPEPELTSSWIPGTACMPTHSESSPKPPADDSEYISCSPGLPTKDTSSKRQLVPVASLISDNNTSKPVYIQQMSDGSDHEMVSDKHHSNTPQPLSLPEDHTKQTDKQVLQQQKQPQSKNKQSITLPGPAGDSQIMSASSSKKNGLSQPHASSPSPSPQTPSISPQVSENTPPWTSSRHKHPSGSSTSSQKSRRISGDSDKSLKKGSKSDSNSSLSSSGGRNKRRTASGEKSPGGNSDKGPLSPLKLEEFSWGGDESGQMSGKSLEAKMVHMEAKIRHSLGDVTDESADNKEGSGQGLIRPGSTPCIQHLHSSNDELGSRSSGDPISVVKTYQGSHPTSRSRHSLSDLGTYQQISSGSLSTSPVVSNLSTGNSTSTASDIVTPQGLSSCPEQPEKVLNYAQLDLSTPQEVERDGKGLRAKSKNSSDSNDKHPPLSYAKIDFEKCQSMKTLTLEGSQDNSSKS